MLCRLRLAFLVVVGVCHVMGGKISTSLINGVCLCANEPNVIAIKNPGQSGGTIDSLQTGQCFISNGGIYHHSGNTWYELKDVNGQIGWVDGFYLNIEPMNVCDPKATVATATNHVASGTARDCSVYNIHYNHGEQFHVHGLSCTCDDGAPLCSFTGNACTVGSNIYPDGANFHLATKGDCSCSDGNVQCTSPGGAVGR